MSVIATETAQHLLMVNAMTTSAFAINPAIQSAIATRTMLDTIQRTATIPVPNLSANLKAIDQAFANLARPALIASKALNNLFVNVDAVVGAQDYFTNLRRDTLAFTETANATMAIIARDAREFLNLSPWLQRAPSIEQYQAVRVVEIEAGRAALELDGESERALASLDETLESRLAAVNSALVGLYRGAIGPLAAQGPDWRRHAATSIRELVDHLMLLLAPDQPMGAFHSANPNAIENGEFTRRARLQYVFRSVASGEYTRMAEEDIRLTLATFYPANATVHGLVSRMTPEQMRVYVRRVQGCISTILEAAGY